jgi:hypothetical protein
MQRITLDTGEDYFPGNPAQYVLGKPDEHTARKHAPMPRKPTAPKPTGDTLERIKREIADRLATLAPAVKEYRELTEVRDRLRHAIGDNA